MSFIQIKPALVGRLRSCLFEQQCIAWKRQSWYSLPREPLLHGLAVMLLPRYITKTQLGTFKDATQTTARQFQRTNRLQTISPASARFRCYPPALYTRSTSRALFPSQAWPTPTRPHPNSHSLASFFVGRGTASTARHPSTTQSFILYSIPLLIIRPISRLSIPPIRSSSTKPKYINIMPLQAYGIPSGSGAMGFFPTGPSAPHAFATMHTSPRDQHSMYASLGTPSFHVGKSSQVKAGNTSKSSRKK